MRRRVRAGAGVQNTLKSTMQQRKLRPEMKMGRRRGVLAKKRVEV